MRNSTKVGVLTLCFALFAGAATATEFKDDAATEAWAKRSELMARIAGDGTSQVSAADILTNMRTSCDGLQGEQMSHEYGKVPRWALASQLHVCTAYDRWRGGGLFASKAPCKDLEFAIRELGEAKAGDDPPATVTAAANLKSSTQALLTSVQKGGALRCRY